MLVMQGGMRVSDFTNRVEMNHITKSFGGVHALKDVSLQVSPGEIHALVGENGAGKSTLMKILSGAYQKDSGVIKIDGQPVEILNPHIGRKLGIGIIYQEFALAPDLTVAENIFLGRLSNGKGLIDWSRLYKQANELLESVGFTINPRLLVGELSVAYQQVVEITKALSEHVKILILDEPTAVLAPQEVERLFKILAKLKQRNVSIIYISHRLDEVFRIADQITVIKDGSVMGTVASSKVTNEEVISMMIGRKLAAMFPKRECTIGQELFRVEGLNRGRKVKNVSFVVKAGEVLGIAGLVGSGRTEVVRAIFGADPKETGRIILENTVLKINSPRDAVRHGIGLVPENRKEQGVILALPVKHNVTMANLKKIVNWFGMIKQKVEKTISQELVERLNIKTKSIESEVSDLSGGNQQKVALAKWFNTDCKIIIMDEPTRGVDVGAKVEIYHLINELASKGLGIIIISSEMMEVIGICDRVMVMNEGRIMGTLNKEELSEENIMKLAIAR
jgi:ribose transport system ATP-binding protein